MTTAAARRAHYRRFYETDPPPGDDLLVVIGNCQAESVRQLLDPDGVRSVRVPPVFEMDAGDVRLLRLLLSRATALATQPVREDYRGLPLGTTQLAADLRPDVRLVRFPIVRYAGLHPFHVVVHSAPDVQGSPAPLPQPPAVPYHDLRTVAAALHRRPASPIGGPTVTEPGQVRAVAHASLAELRRREATTDVVVSWALDSPGPEHMRTVNHPGNPVLLALAAGVASALGAEPPRDPGRPLLDAVHAPVEPVVSRAWGHCGAARPVTWRIQGRDTSVAAVARHHLHWYSEHPHVAPAVWRRHEPTAALLGLA